jgi:glycogen operon protein
VISQVKLIAEPWDVGPGGYQVGAFPWQWMEWNGKYRDAVRRFWRGDANVHGEFASRIAGSSDLYEHSERSPSASINFITAHDGFTLEDLVSYEQKHNHANLEENRDGSDANYSRNFGVEGPTDDETILRRRSAAKRALMSTLLLSQGIPMILGGDEICRTQNGNNNAYCHDSELNWHDWDLTEQAQEFLEFVQQMIAFRKSHPNFRRHHFLTGVADMERVKDILWWHPDGREMTLDDWHDPNGRELGMVLRGDRILDTDARGILRSDATYLLLFNALDEPSTFILPPHPSDGGGWAVITAAGDAEASASSGSSQKVPGHSLTILQALES